MGKLAGFLLAQIVLPSSRSYNFGAASFLPEANTIIIDYNRISSVFSGSDLGELSIFFNTHERLHATVSLGDTLNRLAWFDKTISEINGSARRRPNAELIVNLEYASEILHARSAGIQEALNAYVSRIRRDLYHDERFSQALLESCRAYGITAKRSRELLERLRASHDKYGKVFERGILSSNGNVRRVFQSLLRIQAFLDDSVVPFLVAYAALDIPKTTLNKMIRRGHTVNPQFRFNIIVDTIMELRKKEVLLRIPRTPLFSDDIANNSQKAKQFLSFVNERTGLEFGLLDPRNPTYELLKIDESRAEAPELGAKLQKRLFHYINSILKRTLKVERNTFQAILNSLTHSSLAYLTAITINDKLILGRDQSCIVETFSNESCKHFSYLLAKDCLIEKKEVGPLLKKIMTLDQRPIRDVMKKHYPDFERFLENLESVSQKIEFEAASNYDAFNELRKNRITKGTS